MLMKIDPLSMRGSVVMTMAMISPSQRDASPAEQLRRSPRLVLPRFRLKTATLRPESFLLIFSRTKDAIYKKMGTGGLPGGPRGRGRALHPRGQGVAPLWCFLRPIFLIYSKTNFHGVLGLLELCRIGFQRLLLFHPEFQLPAFPLFMVNLVK